MIKIPHMTMRERAFDYPYEAPTGAFLIKQGYCGTLPENYDFSGRYAVLSVGSNRAPAQLYRKFGDNAEVAVTPVRMHDCDIVHVANFAPYGAVPCSAVHSPGSSVVLNIAWLDASQLELMHSTESLGDAYDFIKWEDGYAEHLSPLPLPHLFGYASRKGALSIEGRGPFGLARIHADTRHFETMSQHQVLSALAMRFTDNKISVEDWVDRIQTTPEYRDECANILSSEAIHTDTQPWQLMPL